MTYYEIYFWNGVYQVWKWTDFGAHGERFKVFKTLVGARKWTAKQWARVIWR